MGRLIEMNKLSDLQTPCYIVDTKDFCNNIIEFKNVLGSYFESSIVSYSVKTNSLQYILMLAKDEGAYCEVVSYDEYELAKKSGFEISHIIYNGPLKNKKTFMDAVQNGAYVNIETQREIDWLIEFGRPFSGKIGLRLNVNLGVVSPNDAKKGEESSRFGFDYKNGEFQKALNRLNAAGIGIDGIHVHRTSATRSLDVYKNICAYTVKVINDLDLNLSYIDIGGGYYGNLEGKPEYKDYAKTIWENLPNNLKCTIIVEPGNALVASAFKFMTSVIDVKQVGNEIILEVDGSRTDIDPFFHKSKYRYELVTESTTYSEQVQKIAGCTCLEGDVITRLESERKLGVGDRLLFTDQGAYTMTMTPDFIRLKPKVYAYDGTKYKMVRSEGTVDGWIENSINLLSVDTPGILFSNAGRRTTLIKDFKKSLGSSIKTIATDNWCVAPALFAADEYYVTPKINDEKYIENLMEICLKENIKAVTTCIDPEIGILAKNREMFMAKGILPLCPDNETAELCFDKYKMFVYLKKHGIKTVHTFDCLESFNRAYEYGDIDFPVFIKPRCGSGSVGIARVDTHDELCGILSEGRYDYIIQEYMDCEDCDADVYVDTVSHEAVAVFSKRKIETRIGGASKTISFKDDRLFEFIRRIVKLFKFCGPIDMDFFYRDGEYYLSEVNPRFGGAYLHAFGAGVDFPKLIYNNICGIANEPNIGDYDEDVLMIMYDDVVITSKDKLRGDYND